MVALRVFNRDLMMIAISYSSSFFPRHGLVWALEDAPVSSDVVPL